MRVHYCKVTNLCLGIHIDVVYLVLLIVCANMITVRVCISLVFCIVHKQSHVFCLCQYQRTAIHYAAEKGHSDVVAYLSSLPGINVDAQDRVSVYHEESLEHL